MHTDIQIAQQATLLPIGTIAARLGLPEAAIEPYGHHMAKLSLAAMPGLQDRPEGQLVLVSAISPTPAGEGKTTTVIGLTINAGCCPSPTPKPREIDTFKCGGCRSRLACGQLIQKSTVTTCCSRR